MPELNEQDSIFKYFAETSYSDNRFEVISTDTEDEVIIGASCTHVFRLPFLFDSTEDEEDNYFQYATDCKIIYSQGLDIILEKEISDSQVEVKAETDNKGALTGATILTVKLTPLDTAYFKDRILDSWVQLKVSTENNELLYNEKCKLKVTPTLESIEAYEKRKIQ